MLFKYYEKGIDHINEIHERYQAAMLNIKTHEEKVKLSAAYDGELQAYLQDLQQEWFNELGNDPQKLLDDAKQYITAFIKYEYELVTQYMTDEPVLKDLEAYGTGIVKDGVFYIYENIMFAYVRSSFEPYLEVLKEYKEYYQELINCIVAEIKNSPYTYSKSEDTERKYRTKGAAALAGAVTQLPKSYIIPTFRDYINVTSLYQKGAAYVIPLKSPETLQFKEGKLFFSDPRVIDDSQVLLRQLQTNEGIENIDLVTLRQFYGIIYDQFEKSGFKELKDTISVSVPALVGRSNPKSEDIERVIATVKSYHNIAGVVINTITGRNVPSIYQILNFESYDQKLNVITFSSPYFNYVIKKVYDLSIRKNKDGKPEIKSNGTPRQLPTHSYLAHPDIVKERNKAAIDNVAIIIALIETCGNNTPHIKASTLIQQNVQLCERLKTVKNPRQLLAPVFKKTWELLESKTWLKETYKNIQLPDPKNPANIPTMKTLETKVFTFYHEGKIKEKKSEKGS